MITRQFQLEQKSEYPLERDYDINRIIFFDIETTGFAAESTYLYLIGCAYYKATGFELIQWFSEGIQEEALLLSTFFDFLKDYDVIFHYNGTGFDIPYLLRKVKMFGLAYSFDNLLSVDLYKKISPYKKIFKLANFKLKTIEDFLNIPREDTFNGGELIQVYQSYLGKKHYEALRKSRDPMLTTTAPLESDILLNQLLLHNKDDVKGLLLICPILYYSDMFEKPIRILQAGIDEGKLNIRFEITAQLPVWLHSGDDLSYFSAHGNIAHLSVQVYEGELKHYYENYKDYYYLPAEDYAIHKSVAHYVDKDFRTKAKPSNCYVKKQGIFAPQYELLISPYFKINYQDRISFSEVHTDFLLQEENLERYVRHILSHLVTG